MPAANYYARGPNFSWLSFGEGKTCLSFKLVTELSDCVLYGFVNVKTMRSLGSSHSMLTVWSVCMEPDLEGNKHLLTIFYLPVLY